MKTQHVRETPKTSDRRRSYRSEIRFVVRVDAGHNMCWAGAETDR